MQGYTCNANSHLVTLGLILHSKSKYSKIKSIVITKTINTQYNNND
jgi:hypothetical protein